MPSSPVTTIDVIPLRRLPASLPFFSYTIPPGMSLTVGSLVRIPFRRRRIEAIVWNTHSAYTGPAQPITEVLTEKPVLTPWQIQIIALAADMHATTPGNILHTILPAIRTLKSCRIQLESESLTTSDTWWYTSRAEIIEQLQAAVGRQKVPVVILCPTKEAIDVLMNIIPNAHRFDGDTSQRAFGKLYTDVASGAVRCVIGTYPGVFLPFPSRPMVVLDQEELPGHQQTNRAPFLDIRAILSQGAIPMIVTSPAPTLRYWRGHHPKAPTVQQERLIGRLDQGTLSPLVSAAVQPFLSASPVLWLLPRRGFAGSIACSDCDWICSCPACHRTLRWTVKDGRQAVCGFCGQTTVVPTTCPTCHSAQVRYRGFSDARLRQSLNEIGVEGQHHIVAYDAIPDVDPKVVVHTCVDTLVQYHDFAAEERAWQLIHRVSARFPMATHVLQTYQPNFSAWQYWATGQAESWYAHALDERLRLHLPPACDAWVIHWRGEDGARQIATIQARIAKEFSTSVTCLEAPVHQKSIRTSPRFRLMICSTNGRPLAATLDWRQWFPAPWTIDTNPNGWLV